VADFSRSLQPPPWAWLWLVVVAVALATRPILPVDETRYLAVAWEMWREKNFLVPHLNGETYSHKPPLLFWLVNVGWAVFGVNEWWPRLVAPLFGLGTLYLTYRLARALWPEKPLVAEIAPLILFGSVFWTVFATLTMFDLMLAFCALLSLLGLVHAWRAAVDRGRVLGFALFGLGIGLGVLAKGPAILLHTLPVAVLAPLWGPRLGGSRPAISWGRWYGGTAAGVGLGAAVGLAWAIPAAIAGGRAFAHAIFVGQSAGRMVESFAHDRPWWWYAAALAPLLWPWTIWPALWRAIGGVRMWRAGRGFAATLADGGVRFGLVWFAVAFVVFSAISGKQLHYLLPEFPAIALVFAFLVAHAETGGIRRGNPMFDQAIPGAIAAVIGVLVAVLPLLPLPPRLLERVDLVDSFWLLAFSAAGLAVAALPLRRPTRGLKERTVALAVLSVVLVVAVHLAARPQIVASLDLRVPAERLAAWERAGEALAHIGKYHGQFNFLGRLEKPVAAIGLVDRDIERWLDANPIGKIVSYRRAPPPSGNPQPLFIYPFRGEIIAVWDRAQLAADPDVADRE
jgi:4-amino-4-deoxy-L-arabinose transferase-like glycosyltransferase